MNRRMLTWAGLACAAVAVAGGVWHATASAATGPDMLVQLTSGPITAHSGQQVTHTIEVGVAGETREAKSQMTFSTTVPLEGATASATAGTCHVVSPVSVTCELTGAVSVDEPVLVTITGGIPAATVAGQVVYNVATVVTEGSDPEPANNTSSNAYTLTAAVGAPASAPAPVPHPVGAVVPSRSGTDVWGALPAVLAAAGVLFLLRHKRSTTASARHRRPARYRARHARSAWRRFVDTELRHWGRRPRHRAVSVPATGLVLVLLLTMMALPGPTAAQASKPDRPSAGSEQTHKDRDKKKKKPRPEPSAAPESPIAPAPPSIEATPNETVPNETVPNETVPNETVPNETVPNETVPNETSPVNAPVEPPPRTDLAKTVAAMHRALRRAEYLRQMATCTRADLGSARARAAKLEEDARGGRGNATELEDARARAATLQMALEGTEAELKRAEARAADLNKQLSEGTASTTAFTRVVDGRMSSPFGNRFDPYHKRWQLHAGVDIAAAMGAPIRAASAGLVRQAGWDGGYGNHTCLEHGDVRGERLTTCYAHQSAVSVAVGQTVPAGHIIGRVGSTGASTGPHLHFEVRLGGRAVDPTPWMQRA